MARPKVASIELRSRTWVARLGPRLTHPDLRGPVISFQGSPGPNPRANIVSGPIWDAMMLPQPGNVTISLRCLLLATGKKTIHNTNTDAYKHKHLSLSLSLSLSLPSLSCYP